MTGGIPVVATTISGVPEVDEHAVTGLLIQPGDAPGMAQAVGRLADDPALAARLAKNAEERVLAFYGVERMVQETELLYTELLGAGRQELRG
jgi:glycosyltransferase involved in cell wall biosynthesis